MIIQKTSKNKKRREKLHSDPEYKAKIYATNNEAQRIKYKENSEWRENKILKQSIYHQLPEVKERRHQQYINRKTNNPEAYALQLIKQRERYHNDPEYRETHRKRVDAREKIRLQTDEEFCLRKIIKSAFGRAFRYYSKNGKILSLKEYGIDADELIHKLGSPPSDGYDIDHIIPVSLFNHDDKKQIKLCWSPENLQWLESDFNRNEKKDYISDNIDDYPEELHKHWRVAYKNYLKKSILKDLI